VRFGFPGRPGIICPAVLILIAAMSENRVIGSRGRLPWRLPLDMARFKRLTMGHAVIMGRKTYDSLRGPLPGRHNIVVSRNPFFAARDIRPAPSLAGAIGLAGGDREIYVIGGGEIYALALPAADRIELTVVHAEVEGDAFFPEIDEAEWKVVAEETHEADERHAFAFTFRTLERV